jgi:poly(A) polymerase
MAGPGELGYRHGAEAAADVVILRAVLAGTLPDPAQIDAARHGAAARFPVRAADLMDGLSGPALGRRLAELEAAWIASGFTATRDDLLGRN